MNSEQSEQVAVRYLLTQIGGVVWRNNVGSLPDNKTGRWVRYGLANDSEKMNRRIKSSDLVGIWPTIVTPDMVGSTIGRFLAIECKRPGWTYTGKGRESAQKRFIDLVNSLGGLGFFIDSADKLCDKLTHADSEQNPIF